MDFDKPKVYGDTFISDGLVFPKIAGTLLLAKSKNIQVQFRADPVLYKENLPPAMKKFNDIGSL